MMCSGVVSHNSVQSGMSILHCCTGSHAVSIYCDAQKPIDIEFKMIVETEEIPAFLKRHTTLTSNVDNDALSCYESILARCVFSAWFGGQPKSKRVSQDLRCTRDGVRFTIKPKEDLKNFCFSTTTKFPIEIITKLGAEEVSIVCSDLLQSDGPTTNSDGDNVWTIPGISFCLVPLPCKACRCVQYLIDSLAGPPQEELDKNDPDMLGALSKLKRCLKNPELSALEEAITACQHHTVLDTHAFMIKALAAKDGLNESTDQKMRKLFGWWPQIDENEIDTNGNPDAKATLTFVADLLSTDPVDRKALLALTNADPFQILDAIKLHEQAIFGQPNKM